MPRHRLPDDERRDTISFRLPGKLIKWLLKKGNGSIGSAAEKIIRDAYERDRHK